MDLILQWSPTIVTITIWSVLFVGRNWLKTKIVAGIEHNFNSKLEELRSEHRKFEETFKSELRSKESEISTLREAVITGRNQRQALVDKRKIQAVENLWKGVIELKRFHGVAAMMAVINYENVVAEAPKNPKMRKMFETINSKSPNIEDYDTNLPANERPFVSPLAWAYFSALQAIVIIAYMRAKTLESGIDGAEKFINEDAAKNLVKIALTHRSAYIDERGAYSFYYLIEELENELLNELNKVLDGKLVDRENIHQAAEIMKAVKEVSADKM